MTLAHLSAVLSEVEPLARLFVDAGHDLYLVGGIVRDQWLDSDLDDSSDIDLTTDAHPATIKQLVTGFADNLWTQGEKFGTIGLRADGRDYEITTFRAESYTSDSRKPTVSFGDRLDVDLSRRDFTVNAMAIQLPGGELVDPYGGVADLEDQQLRTPLSPEISFSDDPLRMLRAARFGAKFSLVPTAELIDAAIELHQRIRIVAIERIGIELRRLLSLDASPVGLRFLSQTGLLAEVLTYGEPDRIPHVQGRLDRAISLVEASPRDWHLALSAIGLVVFDDSDGVQAMAQRLRLAGDDEKAIVGIARAVDALPRQATPDAAALRRFAVEHGLDEEPIRLAFRLTNEPDDAAAFLAAVDSVVSAEGIPELALIDGGAIMSALGVKPGPVVGQAQAHLQQCYFEQGPMTEEEQLSLLQTWWADQTNKS